jgi:hypothetical protein
MPVFAVIAPFDDGRLALAVQNKFPRHYKFGPGQYVVNGLGPTAHAVTLQLGGGSGELGKLVVFSVAGYWGYHDQPLWEWLTLNSRDS